jgi:hypothetical protein
MAGTSKFVFGAMIMSAALVSGAALADGPQQVQTATTHAGFAAAADDIAGVMRHMHHTLNCLVGPSGQGFDASAGNPCNGQGQGAIPDTADAATKMKLQAAAAKVRETVAMNDYAAAKQSAAGVAAMLK